MSHSQSKSKKSTKLTIRKYRIFSEAFKRETVARLAAGEMSIGSFCTLWQVSRASIYNWIYRYSPDYQKGTILVIQKDSEATKTQELLERVAQLERTLGQKQMVIDYQNKLIEIASQELKVDLKKTFRPTP